MRGSLPLLSALLIGGAAIVQAQAPVTAESRWNAVTACTAQPDDRSRHTCVDQVLRQAGVLTAEHEERDRRQRFGLGREPAPAAASIDADASTKKPDDAPADRVELKIAAVQATRDDKLIITTVDGAVWRQIESMVLPLPAAGQTITIRKAALGSFLCSAGTKATYRCVRSR